MLHGVEVRIRPPNASDRDGFVAAVERSRELHRPWVEPPATRDGFVAWLARLAARTPHQRHAGFVATADGELAGFVNLSEIVLGAFRSGYLGYAVFVPWERNGVMREAVRLVVDHAFADEESGGLGLHRVEANIQPRNVASKALVAGLGFRLEGLSPGYLRIAGEWRDHERYAVTAEAWR
jgi:ribosomal-protein-alanine N-acetyltransferase